MDWNAFSWACVALWVVLCPWVAIRNIELRIMAQRLLNEEAAWLDQHPNLWQGSASAAAASRNSMVLGIPRLYSIWRPLTMPAGARLNALEGLLQIHAPQ